MRCKSPLNFGIERHFFPSYISTYAFKKLPCAYTLFDQHSSQYEVEKMRGVSENTNFFDFDKDEVT